MAADTGTIPLSRVYQSETIDRRILEVVKGGNYILGPECKAFEKELAAYFGVKHVVLSQLLDGGRPPAAHRADMTGSSSPATRSSSRR